MQNARSSKALGCTLSLSTSARTCSAELSSSTALWVTLLKVPHSQLDINASVHCTFALLIVLTLSVMHIAKVAATAVATLASLASSTARTGAVLSSSTFAFSRALALSMRRRTVHSV
jgi:hypothetical protein